MSFHIDNGDLEPAEESFVVLGSSSLEAVSLDEANESQFLRFSGRFPAENGGEITESLHGHTLSELQQENACLKDLLRKNSVSIREQFRAVETWHNDVMETHRLHKAKFGETRELIKKLRAENAQLKLELDCVKKNAVNLIPEGNLEAFDTTQISYPNAEELMAELEGLKAENKELADENAKLKSFNDAAQTVNSSIPELKAELERVKNEIRTLSDEGEKLKRENAILRSNEDDLRKRADDVAKYEEAISSHQRELKEAKLKLMKSESLKLEFAKHKQEMQNTRFEIQDLKSRLKDALELVLRQTSSSVNGVNGMEEKEALFNGIVRELPKIINFYILQLCSVGTEISNLSHFLNSTSDLTVERVKEEFASLRNYSENYHKTIAEHNIQIKNHLSGIEHILSEYRQTSKALSEATSKLLSQADMNTTQSNQILALQAQLLFHKETIDAKEVELLALRNMAETFQKESEERDHLKSQLEGYKADYEEAHRALVEVTNAKEQLVRETRHLHREYLQHEPTNAAAAEDPEFNFQENPQFICPVCERDFRNLTLLQEHVNTCLDNL